MKYKVSIDTNFGDMSHQVGTFYVNIELADHGDKSDARFFDCLAQHPEPYLAAKIDFGELPLLSFDQAEDIAKGIKRIIQHLIATNDLKEVGGFEPGEKYVRLPLPLPMISKDQIVQTDSGFYNLHGSKDPALQEINHKIQESADTIDAEDWKCGLCGKNLFQSSFCEREDCPNRTIIH